jgi:hypothetical protein
MRKRHYLAPELRDAKRYAIKDGSAETATLRMVRYGFTIANHGTISPFFAKQTNGDLPTTPPESRQLSDTKKAKTARKQSRLITRPTNNVSNF